MTIPLTIVAASLLTACLAYAQIKEPPLAPPPQDRTQAGTDEKEVARAISALQPNREQYDALLKGHKEARVALKLKAKEALRALAADYDARTEKLKADQAAEKQAMLGKMGR